MKRSFDLRPWLKPVLTCILGLILIFKPGSLTTSIAWAVGFLIALVGAGKLVAFFRDPSPKRDFLGLCGAVILLILGFSILNKPVNLEKQVGLVVGIVLLLQGIRGFVSPFAAHEKISSAACCVMGVLLMVLPLFFSRLVVVLCGIVVLIIGIGMILDLLALNRHNGGSDHIIDV